MVGVRGVAPHQPLDRPGREFLHADTHHGWRIAQPARAPALATDAAGDVHLAWTVGDDPAADIQLAKSTDRGWSFQRLAPVHRNENHADAPKVAVDGKGIVHLVYAESPAGMSGRYHIFYTRSADGGRTFTKPQRISGLRPAEFTSEQFPALSLDGEDNLYVIWELFMRQSRYPRGLAMTTSGDGGRSFAAPALVPDSVDPERGVHGSQQGLLMCKLAVNPRGAIAIVNSTFWWDRRSEVSLLRGKSGVRRSDEAE